MAQFDIQAFEEASRQNGERYWLAHELMGWLGYESWPSFLNVITRAQAACARLGIDVTDAFRAHEAELGGKVVRTFKLSRFACLLISMNADSRKPEVANAKAVLAAIADQLIQQKLDEAALLRIETRDDLRGGEEEMAKAAATAGVQGTEMAIFKDAGFRGMYNMPLQDLKRRKGVDVDKTLYDFMGTEELAGNLFRVTQTAARIRKEQVRGLKGAADTARAVGADVRRMMIQNSGVAPEALPPAEHVDNARRSLVKTAKAMKRMDTPKPAALPKRGRKKADSPAD
jgi:DNA-damage-inducible protein D